VTGKEEYVLDDAGVEEIIQECGSLFFYQPQIQRNMIRHLEKLSKFTIDFSLTKNSFQEALRSLFYQGTLPEAAESEPLTPIEQSQKKQDKLKRLAERYGEFQEVRERAEGLAYPMAVFVKELTKGESKLAYQEELTKRRGLETFLNELTEC
jgi:hypothetical protein